MGYTLIELVEIEGTNILGTAMRFTVIVNVDTLATAEITIEDPGDVSKVDEASMTKAADGVYTYVWQSDKDDDEGDYTVIFQLTGDESGDSTTVSHQTFIMEESEID